MDSSFSGVRPPVPPVQINARQCGEVKVEVKIITETREHDTLRRWAELIDRVTRNPHPKRVFGPVSAMDFFGERI